MKSAKFYLCLLLLSLLFACSGGEPTQNEADPIELSKRVVRIDHLQISDHIDILSGNGDYRIAVKSVFIDEQFRGIPFEEHVKVYLEGERIVAERLLLEDYYMCVTCVLFDGRGIKKTFVVENPGMLGIHDFDD